jgi:hypothetical protein
MSIAEPATPSKSSPRDPSARILQFKQAFQDRTAAVGGWASERAGAVKETAAGRPLATAGISATAAFAGGLALGLLMAGRVGDLRARTKPLASRLRSRLNL